MYLSVENTEALTQPEYWVVDAILSWVSSDDTWTVSAGIKNMLDEVYAVEGQEFTSIAGIQTAYFGDPRTYTIGVEYRY